MKKKMFGIISKVIAKNQELINSLNLIENNLFPLRGTQENIKLWTDIILPAKF